MKIKCEMTFVNQEMKKACSNDIHAIISGKIN